MRRPIALTLLAAYLAVLLVLTLGGFYHPDSPRNFRPFHSIEHDLRAGGRDLVVNLLGNLVAFLPMGFLVPALAGGRRLAARVTLASFGLSASIEVIQGLSRRRVADVDDVILNTAGGLIGLGLWLALRAIWRQKAYRIAQSGSFRRRSSENSATSSPLSPRR